MSANFDNAMDGKQTSVIEDTRKIYSKKVIEKRISPTHMGEMEQPQGYGKVKGPCGDTIKIFRMRSQVLGSWFRVTFCLCIWPFCTANITTGQVFCSISEILCIDKA